MILREKYSNGEKRDEIAKRSGSTLFPTYLQNLSRTAFSRVSGRNQIEKGYKMVRKLSTSPEDSDLSLPTGEEDKDFRESDPLSSSYPTWSSRVKCLEAYVCVVMSFPITLTHCRIIGLYGSVVFIAYIIWALVVVVPIMVVEIMLGRYVMGNVIKAWSMVPVGKGLLTCLFAITAATIYSNNLCIVYLLKYAFSFYHGYIPWDHCRSPWAKENCFVFQDFSASFQNCLSLHPESYCRNLSWESSGMQYWKYKASDDQNFTEVGLSVVFLVLSTVFVVLVNVRGHRSFEKAFVVLVYLPLIISFVLTFAAYDTIKALPGIMSFLRFNWEHMTDWRMWLEVFQDFILTAGLGTFCLSFVSSHGVFQDNITTDVLVVIFAGIFASLLTPVPIFNMAASYEYLEGLYDRKELIFVWMSDALLLFPSPNVLWAFLFYLEMILMSVANLTVMTLAITEALWAIFPEKKFLYYSIIVGCISFAITTPGLLLTFNFEFPIQTSIIVTLLLCEINLKILYGFRRLTDDYHFMFGYPPSLFFLRLFWILLIPVLLGVLTVKLYFRVPNEPLDYIVFIYAAVPLVLFLVTAVVQIILAAKQGRAGGAFLPDPNWGPENPILMMSRVVFDTRTITKEFVYRQELYRKPLFKPPDFSQQNIVQLI